MLTRKGHTRPLSPITSKPPTARHALSWYPAPAVPARCSSRRMKARSMPKRPRSQNCTHVTMDRVYGRDQHCFVCGRTPSIGYLYECREDCVPWTPRYQLSNGQVGKLKSSLRCELEKAGLSESVISAAEQGHYTERQLNQLVTQKLELKQLIEDAVQCDQINEAIVKLSALAQAANADAASGSKPDDSSTVCGFRACHTCRPYYRDRVFISFAAVLAADFTPITPEDTESLPVIPAPIMRSISIPPSGFQSMTHTPYHPSISFAIATDGPTTASTASNTSEATFMTTQSDLDEINAQHGPRRRFYNMGHRSSGDIARDLSKLPQILTGQGLRTALQGIFRTSRESSSSGSNITLPVPRTGTVRNSGETQPIGEFDIGALRRVRRQKERNQIRTGTYTGGFEDVDTQAAPALNGHKRQKTAGSSLRTESSYSCVSDTSDDGKENESVMHSGAGVETPRGNILNVSVPSKQETIVETKEMESDSDDGPDGGVDLQSVMAQV